MDVKRWRTETIRFQSATDGSMLHRIHILSPNHQSQIGTEVHDITSPIVMDDYELSDGSGCLHVTSKTTGKCVAVFEYNNGSLFNANCQEPEQAFALAQAFIEAVSKSNK